MDAINSYATLVFCLCDVVVASEFAARFADASECAFKKTLHLDLMFIISSTTPCKRDSRHVLWLQAGAAQAQRDAQDMLAQAAPGPLGNAQLLRIAEVWPTLQCWGTACRCLLPYKLGHVHHRLLGLNGCVTPNFSKTYIPIAASSI